MPKPSVVVCRGGVWGGGVMDCFVAALLAMTAARFCQALLYVTESENSKTRFPNFFACKPLIFPISAKNSFVEIWKIKIWPQPSH
jgi:hypothetical protein